MRKLILAVAAAGLLGAPAHAVTIDLVPIGNPGNACDTQSQGCFGAVGQTYFIGKYEVTNAQYAEFLNTVDPNGTNPNGIYNSNMGSDSRGGITFDGGAATGAKYAVKTDFGLKPVNFVSWYDAARFTNWLHNGQLGPNSEETGAYTLNDTNPGGITHNTSALFWIPTEDEWYKAAYYDAVSTSYNPYPFADGFNGATCHAPPGPNSHSANCASQASSNLSDRGAYTTSPSDYGTFDQGGNVAEWNETIITGSERGVRGGSLSQPASSLAAFIRTDALPVVEAHFLGFRVASVPEPTTGLLVMGGVLGLAVWRSCYR